MAILQNIGDLLKGLVLNPAQADQQPEVQSLGAKIARSIGKGLGTAQSVLSGTDRQFSPADIAIASEPVSAEPNVMGVFARLRQAGAKGRVAGEQYRQQQAALERAAQKESLEAEKTKAEIGALGGLEAQRKTAADYNAARKDLESRKLDLQKYELDIKKADSAEKIMIAYQNAQTALQNSQAAIIRAEAAKSQAATASERLEFDQEIERAKVQLKRDELAIDKAFKEKQVEIGESRAASYGRIAGAQEKAADSLTSTETETPVSTLTIQGPQGGPSFGIPTSDLSGMSSIFARVPSLQKAFEAQVGPKGGFLGIGATQPTIGITEKPKKKVETKTKTTGTKPKPKIVIKSVK